MGGGIYLNNPEYLTILGSTISNNKALNDSTLSSSGTGGGLYYTCTSSYNCKVNITN